MVHIFFSLHKCSSVVKYFKLMNLVLLFRQIVNSSTIVLCNSIIKIKSIYHIRLIATIASDCGIEMKMGIRYEMFIHEIIIIIIIIMFNHYKLMIFILLPCRTKSFCATTKSIWKDFKFIFLFTNSIKVWCFG